MATEELSASLEDYLEAIFLIIERQQAVRSKDIARRLGVTTASVTGALQGLSSRELINYEPYGVITLTPQGRRKAKELVRSHETLRTFLNRVLALPPEKADEVACKMEHAIPADVLERFVCFVEFMDCCPHAGASWIEGFGFHCENEEHLTRCDRCATEELEVIRQHRLHQGIGQESSCTLNRP